MSFVLLLNLLESCKGICKYFVIICKISSIIRSYIEIKKFVSRTKLLDLGLVYLDT